MSRLNDPDECPPADRLSDLIASDDYAEFASGWRDGLHRRHTNPASVEVIEDLALLLDASSAVDILTRSE